MARGRGLAAEGPQKDQQQMTTHPYGAPRIVVAKVNDDSSLLLEHEPNDLGQLDFKYAEKTLEYLFELWKKPVHLKTFNNQRETTTLTYSVSGMQIGK
jgi:spore cortex formation protein SpoVR/YcgB (stage V sporulation)